MQDTLAKAWLLSPQVVRTTGLLKWATRVVGLAMLLLVAGFLLFANSVGQSASVSPGSADAIVALTGGEARIRAAIDLLAAGNGRRLLISGVHSKTRRSDLEKMVPGTGNLFGCCIDIGRDAKDTVGNADETREWVAGLLRDDLRKFLVRYGKPADFWNI